MESCSTQMAYQWCTLKTIRFLLADHFDPNRPSVQATKPWGFPSVPPTSVATRQGLKQLDTSYNSNWWFQPPRKI